MAYHKAHKSHHKKASSTHHHKKFNSKAHPRNKLGQFVKKSKSR